MGKLTDYGLPIVGALVLHAVVVAMLEWEWAPGSREPVVVQPKAIKAMLALSPNMIHFTPSLLGDPLAPLWFLRDSLLSAIS